MEPVSTEDVQIYVFSFNRGEFLENCLKSIDHCAATFDVTVIDDHSHDVRTRKVLSDFRKRFKIEASSESDDAERKTGGLYSNMRYAFQDCSRRGKRYALFLQDDMQFVRPIQHDDIAAADRFFEANANSAELHTCFMKRFFSSIDQATTTFDESGSAFFRPSNRPGFSGFSAVGLFNVARFERLFGGIRQGEYANNAYAKEHGIQMGLSFAPYMMWLPYPISHRGKKRNIALRIVESLGGCGFYPYDTMTKDMIEQLLTRDRDLRPYAEDWLSSPKLGQVPVWSFAGGLSNLYARGGSRNWIGRRLAQIQAMRQTTSR